jgi:DNA invertase Pin-like site-specific DNA recombinase
MARNRPTLTHDQIQTYVVAAAKEAQYEGFGAEGCDLNLPDWWASYTRQSLEEQTQNNRLPDYLRTCAHQARDLGVIVPLEYVLFDAVSGEHLERADMIKLRQLIAERKIAGVIFPALDRMSREPVHQQIFEVEAAHYGVRLHYADAPNGTDLSSQMVRSMQAYAAKIYKESTHNNARGGQIGRVVKGMVPAHRAAYGYRYVAQREIGPNGRVIIKNAWWEVDELDPDGEPIYMSPASVVGQMFKWLADEGRTFYWIAGELNRIGVKAPDGGMWSPARVSHIAHKRCYVGEHAYNVNSRVSNPNRPLGDITARVKRTLLQAKPESDWVKYEIPALVSKELWQKATDVVTSRGRGRGKQGKKIEALLRNRIYCPTCGNPMIVRRNGRLKRPYYYCSKYFRPWAGEPCGYRKFLPGDLDDVVWEDLSALLSDETWIEQQMVLLEAQDENRDKLIRLQEHKISQGNSKIARVRQGFDGGVYEQIEAKARIAQHNAVISNAEEEIRRLSPGGQTSLPGELDLESLKRELRILRDRKLDEASFEEKLDLIAKLDIGVYPSHDAKSIKVTCRMDLPSLTNSIQNDRADLVGADQPRVAGAFEGCGKVMYAPPACTEGGTNPPDSDIRSTFTASDSIGNSGKVYRSNAWSCPVTTISITKALINDFRSVKLLSDSSVRMSSTCGRMSSRLHSCSFR